MFEVVLAFIGITIAIAAALVGWRLNAQVHELRTQMGELQSRLVLQQQSISGPTAGAVGMDRRLRRTEATEKLLNDRQETIENQQAAEQPYSQAIRLVQQGASVRRLVEELSLSESEADLIVRLHGLRDSA